MGRGTGDQQSKGGLTRTQKRALAAREMGVGPKDVIPFTSYLAVREAMLTQGALVSVTEEDGEGSTQTWKGIVGQPWRNHKRNGRLHASITNLARKNTRTLPLPQRSTQVRYTQNGAAHISALHYHPYSITLLSTPTSPAGIR